MHNILYWFDYLKGMEKKKKITNRHVRVRVSTYKIIAFNSMAKKKKYFVIKMQIYFSALQIKVGKKLLCRTRLIINLKKKNRLMYIFLRSHDDKQFYPL